MSRRVRGGLVAAAALVVPAVSGAPPAGAAPSPTLNRTAVVRPLAGTVSYRRPGGHAVRLTRPTAVPVGSVVDARRGRVSVTVARDTTGHLQHGRVRGGPFRVRQHDGVARLSLVGGDFAQCSAEGGRPVAATSRHKRKRRHPVRRLRIEESGGSYITDGRYGKTQGEGTTWSVADFCGYTTVHAIAGKVTSSAPQFTPQVMGPGDVFSYGCVVLGKRALPFCTAVLTTRAGTGPRRPAVVVFALAGRTDDARYVACIRRPDGSRACLPEPIDPKYLPTALAGDYCFGERAGSYSVHWYTAGRRVGPTLPFELAPPFGPRRAGFTC